MKNVRLFILSAAGLVATGTAGFAQYIPPPSWRLFHAQEVAGQKVFKDQCASCHAQQPGHVVLAPSLKGVVDRPAGSAAGFPYSDALKKSGLVWTEDNLR